MTIDPDDLVVLCNRVEDGPSGVYGSTKEECCQCHKQVWLSPATRRTAERTDANYKILCLACGAQRMQENPDPDDQVLPPSLEQLRELFKGLSEMN
jgi:hypothetical protein